MPRAAKTRSAAWRIVSRRPAAGEGRREGVAGGVVAPRRARPAPPAGGEAALGGLEDRLAPVVGGREGAGGRRGRRHGQGGVWTHSLVVSSAEIERRGGRRARP